MTPEPRDVRRAVAVREQASARVRRITAAALAGAAALTGAFAALAAGSTPGKKTTVRPAAAAKASTHVTAAPVPALVPVRSQAAPAPPEAQAVPAPSVAQSSAPPVAVSGGS